MTKGRKAKYVFVKAKEDKEYKPKTRWKRKTKYRKVKNYDW
jgi:hypothetical protein